MRAKEIDLFMEDEPDMEHAQLAFVLENSKYKKVTLCINTSFKRPADDAMVYGNIQSHARTKAS